MVQSTITSSLQPAMGGMLAFTASLSSIHLVEQEYPLGQKAVRQLRDIESELSAVVDVQSILNAKSDDELSRACQDGFEVAAGYYIKSALLIWRSLNHDYNKLLELSRISTAYIEALFFDRYSALGQKAFINALTGIRVVNKIGEWNILAEEKKVANERTFPFHFLFEEALPVTFLTWCLVTYLERQFQAKARNLREIATGIVAFGRTAYEDAIKKKLHEAASETTLFFWSIDWQLGEAEADLDKLLGWIKHFQSADELLYSLR